MPYNLTSCGLVSVCNLFVNSGTSTDENVAGVYIQNNFSGANGFGLVVSRNGSGTTAAISIGSDSSNNGIISANNTDLIFGKNTSGTFNPYMRINTSGNVGIGTTTPGSILHIKGPSSSGCPFGAELRVWENTFGAVVQGSTQGTTYAFFGNFRYNFTTPASSDALYSLSAGGMLVKDGIHIFTSNPNASTFTPAERLTIDNSGNVGIGTSSPGATLTVTGPNATGAFFQAANDGAGGAVFCRINASSYPYNSFNFFNGNMGIGAYASLSNVNLQICDGNANGTDDMVRLMQCLPGNHAFYRSQRCGGATLIMGPTRNSNDGCIPSESAIVWTTTNNPLVFGTCGRERMRIASNGNAVLGGTSSNIVGFNGTVLTVNGGGNYQGYEVATSNVSRMTMVSDGNNGYLSTRVAGMCLIFETGAASEKMRITSDGNVGIGTTSPSTVLDIRGCNTDNAVTVRNFCGDSYSAIGYVNCQGTLKAAVGIGNNSAAAPFANNAYVYTPASTDFLFYIAGSERMRVRCDGNIGIATTSPSYKLHVNGTFYAAGSSIKYKEGICNYDTDSCLFMCLKPVTYQYKDEWQHLGRELKSQSQIGLIAEDVAQVMPELAILVNEEDEKVVRNVDYEKLSVVLLKEVQKLRQEVDQLKNNK